MREDGGPFSLKLVEDVYMYTGFGSGVLEMYGADVEWDQGHSFTPRRIRRKDFFFFFFYSFCSAPPI